jgi:hypothetical protein
MIFEAKMSHIDRGTLITQENNFNFGKKQGINICGLLICSNITLDSITVRRDYTFSRRNLAYLTNKMVR